MKSYPLQKTDLYMVQAFFLLFLQKPNGKFLQLILVYWG